MFNLSIDTGTRVGAYFGATSGVITTVGLMVGLSSSTDSSLAVVGGVVVIALADSLSDALGIHVAQESDESNSERHIWMATLATFVSKFVIAISFLLPVAYLSLPKAIWASIVWSVIVIVFLSYLLACDQKRAFVPIVAEHLGIAVLVVAASYAVGVWVKHAFG